MNRTLSRELVIILSVFCIALLLLGSIGYATLIREIADLKATNDHLARELDDQDSKINSMNLISRDDLDSYSYPTKKLFDMSSRNGKNYYVIKGGEDLQYWYNGYVDEKYAEERSEEWVSALKTAAGENTELKEDLRSVLSYMKPWSDLARDQENQLTDEGLSVFLDRLKVLPTGELYTFNEKGSLRETDIYLRQVYWDSDTELGPGLYIFFPAINY
ncbi:hypothetical protein IKG06_02935 [Candidatus Saccharibacteria bacterium]|nr:hypothetical protein [Candidatus Saccharibacteria bacterium]